MVHHTEVKGPESYTMNLCLWSCEIDIWVLITHIYKSVSVRSASIYEKNEGGISGEVEIQIDSGRRSRWSSSRRRNGRSEEVKTGGQERQNVRGVDREEEGERGCGLAHCLKLDSKLVDFLEEKSESV